jgi:hypothetical protein
VPLTVPIAAGVVGAALLPPPHAKRKRDEPTRAARAEIRMFTGNLSVGLDVCPALPCFKARRANCVSPLDMT